MRLNNVYVIQGTDKPTPLDVIVANHHMSITYKREVVFVKPVKPVSGRAGLSRHLSS